MAVAPDSVQLSSLKIKYLAHRLTDGTGSSICAKALLSHGAVMRVNTSLTTCSCCPAGRAVRHRVVHPGPRRPSLLDQGLQGSLSLSESPSEEQAFPSVGGHIPREQGKADTGRRPGNSIHGSIDSNLAFAIHLSRPLPFVGDAGGRIIGDQIVASAAIETFDATVLNSVLKTAPRHHAGGRVSQILNFTSGTASGRLSISGPVNDPDFNGELVRPWVPASGPRIPLTTPGPITTRLVFDGKGFHFARGARERRRQPPERRSELSPSTTGLPRVRSDPAHGGRDRRPPQGEVRPDDRGRPRPGLHADSGG